MKTPVFSRHLKLGCRLFGRWSLKLITHLYFLHPSVGSCVHRASAQHARCDRERVSFSFSSSVSSLTSSLLLCSEITVRRRTASQGNPVRRNGRLDSIRANLCQMLRPRKQAGLPRGTSWSPPSRSTVPGLLSARIGTRSLWLWRGQDSRVSRSVPESAAGCCSCSYLTQLKKKCSKYYFMWCINLYFTL